MRNKNIKTKSKLMNENMLILCLIPSFIGVFVFFIAPFAVSIYNAVIDNPVTANFVGLKHFKDVLISRSFRLALQNTLYFLLSSIPLNLIVPLFLASLIKNSPKKNIFIVIFLLPLVIPSGSVVFFWKNIFGINGIINGVFFRSAPVNWIDTSASRIIVLFIFIWKSAGFNMVLFTAGLKVIPVQYYEAASIEGANLRQKFTQITLIYLMPTVFTAFLMSFVNSFKAFKEIYMLYGSYPNSHIYMMQHYIYNQFASVNYQRLAASAYIMTLGFVVIVFAFFRLQNKIEIKGGK